MAHSKKKKNRYPQCFGSRKKEKKNYCNAFEIHTGEGGTLLMRNKVSIQMAGCDKRQQERITLCVSGDYIILAFALIQSKDTLHTLSLSLFSYSPLFYIHQYTAFIASAQRSPICIHLLFIIFTHSVPFPLFFCFLYNPSPDIHHPSI